MNKSRNYVAKHAKTFNRAQVFKCKKTLEKKGYKKHKKQTYSQAA